MIRKTSGNAKISYYILLRKHSANIKSLIHSYNNIKHCLINACEQLLKRLYIDRINRLTYLERLSSLRIKNRKLHMLISWKSPTTSNFKIPIVNLTLQILSERERIQLEPGLEQNFINKNKSQRKYLSANLESIRGRKSMEIPWKTKRKNQESRSDDICCVWCETKVYPKKQPVVTPTQKNTDKRSEATKRLVGTLIC